VPGNHVGDDLLTAVMEMGFAPERIEWALRSTNGTLEAALDHIEMHQDEPVPPDAATSPVGDDAESSKTAVPQVRIKVLRQVYQVQCV